MEGSCHSEGFKKKKFCSTHSYTSWNLRLSDPSTDSTWCDKFTSDLWKEAKCFHLTLPWAHSSSAFLVALASITLDNSLIISL